MYFNEIYFGKILLLLLFLFSFVDYRYYRVAITISSPKNVAHTSSIDLSVLKTKNDNLFEISRHRCHAVEKERFAFLIPEK